MNAAADAILTALHHRDCTPQDASTILGIAGVQLFVNHIDTGDMDCVRAFDLYQKITREMLIEVLEQKLTEER